MINVSDEVKEYFLADSTQKEININARVKGKGTPDYTNYYRGDIVSTTISVNAESFAIPANIFPESNDFEEYGNYTLAQSRRYASVSFDIQIIDLSSSQTTLSLDIYVKNTQGQVLYYQGIKDFVVQDYLEKQRFFFTSDFQALSLACFTGLSLNSNNGNFIGDVVISNIQIEFGDDLDDFPRDYTISLNNDNILFEDFKYTESLCSKDNLKFGLCEASNVEFSVMNVDNAILKDATFDLNCQIKDHYDRSLLEQINWYYNKTTPSTNPAGTINQTFIISANGTRIDVSSDIIDTELDTFYQYANSTDLIGVMCKMKINSLSGDTNIPRISLGCWLFYEDGYNRSYTGTTSESLSSFSDWTYCYVPIPKHATHGKVVKIQKPLFRLKDSSGNDYPASVQTSIDFSVKEFGIFMTASSHYQIYSFRPDMCLFYNGTFNDYLDDLECKVEMGKFKVSSVKSSIDHLLTKKTVTAYDDIIRLEQNAADWYAQYMFGIDFYGDTVNGFEFARQIYSTYWNYIRKVIMDSPDNYNQTVIQTIAKASAGTYLSTKKVKYNSSLNYWIRYIKISVSTISSRRYRVIYNGVDKYYARVWMSDYYDPLWRGLFNANILIEETRSNTNKNRFLVDAGDFFMLSPDCTSFDIYIPYDYYDGDNSVTIRNLIESDIVITRIDDPIDLENGHIRLLYYDWNTKEIFESDTSITGRDVVRSLLEPCGCFYRMNRKTNIPEFVYCTKGGLYPSETLYPADDLYPRTGTDQLLPVTKYMSFERGENTVLDFGKIQIKKGGTINDGESICEWQYTGDANSLNTYIIEDNIFYCNDKLTYSSDMAEVAEMLEKMWLRISNMGYVANITRALGMPWVECGDRIGIFTINGGAETFVFRRTLKGIQHLEDTFESNGDEYNQSISNYNFGG